MAVWFVLLLSLVGTTSAARTRSDAKGLARYVSDRILASVAGNANQNLLAQVALPGYAAMMHSMAMEQHAPILAGQVPIALGLLVAFVVCALNKYRSRIGLPVSRATKAVKDFLTDRIQNHLTVGVHYYLEEGANLARGLGVFIHPVGNDLLLSQGPEGWEFLSAAYIGITNPHDDTLRNALRGFAGYKAKHDVARKRKLAMHDAATVYVGHVESGNATQKVRRAQAPLYQALIHPEDTTPGGMTGQLVVAKGLADPADSAAFKAAKSRQGNIAPQLSEIKSLQVATMNAQTVEMNIDNPHKTYFECALSVGTNAHNRGLHVKYDFHGNVCSPAEQRLATFNHAHADLPPNQQLRLQQQMPLVAIAA